MYQLIVALVLLAVSASAGAVQVYLVSSTAVGGSGLISPGTSGTAIWAWNGTNLLTSTGSLFSYFTVPSGSLFTDSVTDLGIDTSTGTASATSYSCAEGTFLAAVGAHGCGNYSFENNLLDESTTVWGAAPGFTAPGTDVNQTIGGDDVSFGPPRDVSIYDMNLISWDGTTLVLDNFVFTGKGGDPVPTGGSSLTFSTINPVPVPAAVYLFGSALGLLGWMRRGQSKPLS